MNFGEEFEKLDATKSIAIGLLLAGLYWVLFYDDGSRMLTQIQGLQQEIVKQTTAKDHVEKAIQDKEKFQKEIDEINLNLRDFQLYFSAQLNSNAIQEKVSQLATEHDLVLETLRPIEKQAEFSTFNETAVDLTLQGDFHNIMEFISSLSKMKRVLDFSKMEFETITSGARQKINLKTTLVVYSSTQALGSGENDGT